MTNPLVLHTVAIREDGCFSVMLWEGRPFAVTVERTFENNRVVIPAGLLVCKRTTRFEATPPYSTFEIIVPGHTRILFHKGNVEDDSKGCVIVGKAFGMLNGKTSVQNPKEGFEEFAALTAELEEFNVQVEGR